MKKFSEIAAAFAALSASDQEAVEWAIEHARATLQHPDYDEESDDHSPYYFEEVGSAIYAALYPPEPEPEVIPEPLPIPGDGEELHYCRRCRAPRIFKREAYHTPPEGIAAELGVAPGSLAIYEWVCSGCGAIRQTWTIYKSPVLDDI